MAICTHGYQNHAVRSERYRYIRYANGSEELYDHAKDPYEWTNLAGDKAHTKIKKDLARRLPTKNVKAKPKSPPKGSQAGRKRKKKPAGKAKKE